MTRTAVVTGSTSGIGQAVAEALAAEGHNIVLNGFGGADQIEEQRLKIAKDHGVSVTYSAADMTKPAEIRAMIAKAQQDHGSVDVLVNNAGIQHVAPIDEFPSDKWDAIIAINLTSAFHTTAAALPIMRANGWGRIINIASAHGLVASPFKSAYVAAKHGVLGFTKPQRWSARKMELRATRSVRVMCARLWSKRKYQIRPKRVESQKSKWFRM